MAAILLFNADIQVATDGVIKVLDAERTRRHLGLVQDTALLPYHHAGVAARHARDFRRVAAQVRRQHAVIGGKAGPRIAKAPEQRLQSNRCFVGRPEPRSAWACQSARRRQAPMFKPVVPLPLR
ncbi:hypothetical protein G6F68_018415 [Rhizopus microsporus]|nr:hypothetical protein G6F68_018415 [Rhizopus microsporus]